MSPLRELFLFELDAAPYAVLAQCVRESLWLPELFPLEAAPGWIAGVFNLRGEIVPVVDLGVCIGHRGARTRRACLSDQVVVLNLDGANVGLIVHRVLDLVAQPEADCLPPPRFEPARTHPLVHALVQVDDALVSLLDLSALGRAGPPPEAYDSLAGEETFCFGCSAAEHAAFRARGRALRVTAARAQTEQLGLAVIALEGERFGVELAQVQEFCRADTLLPLPGSPPHVAGVLGLRGRCITLLELAAALGLAPPALARAQAVIVKVADEPVGLMIDEVRDLLYLDPGVLQPAAQRTSEIRALAVLDDGPLPILDLPALLGRKAWRVEAEF